MVDLTLHDSTQVAVLKEMRVTERLLRGAGRPRSDGGGQTQIYALPDLGLAHNATRMLGGFFTGALYCWDSDEPFIPVDATVNIDTVSVYRIREIFRSKRDFIEAIGRARNAIKERSSYLWNFDVGNHFITCAGTADGKQDDGSQYLVLHASAAEFKNQCNGLYPVDDVWYRSEIQVVEDQATGRYLRYIRGTAAERFATLAHMLLEHNRLRHRFIAELVCGGRNVIEELVNIPHYGMPTANSIAIGVQWLVPGQLFLLLTGPERPLYLMKANGGGRNSVKLEGREALLYPHGLGKRSREPLELSLGSQLAVNGRCYQRGESLVDDDSLEVRELFQGTFQDDPLPPIISQIVERCPADVVARLLPCHSYSYTTERCGSRA